jgi:hypothetical protein
MTKQIDVSALTTPWHRRLKDGINIYRSPNGLRCGTARKSFAISQQGSVRALEMMSANWDEDLDIASECGLSPQALAELIAHLEENEFLETTPSVLAITTRFQSVAKKKRRDVLPDAAFSQLAHRVVPELSYARLLPGVADSGAATINARQNVRIEIYGSDRIAILLYGILLASGATHTHFAMGTRSHDPLLIDTDLTAGFIRATDIGASFKSRIEDLAKELSLFPIESHESAQELDPHTPERFIKIHVGKMDPLLLAQWMASGNEHIVISPSDGGHLLVGPLVTPAKTPCTRCRELSISDIQGEQEKISLNPSTGLRDEPPVFVAHLLAGLIAGLILQSIDATSQSDLDGAYIALDYLHPGDLQRIALARNPKCGCAWL